jgi:hypothetical protein
MSTWGLGSVGEGFAKLSNLAEAAAQNAAALKADAEAKLVATLNSDGEIAAARAAAANKGAVRDGEGNLDFSSMPRNELEDLCARRSEKLKQAVQKIRAQQNEYTRVQRDYEQLQEIVRSDAVKRNSVADDNQLARVIIDLNDARDYSAILKEQLVEKDAAIGALEERVQKLQATKDIHSFPNGTGTPEVGTCSVAPRAELECAESPAKDVLAEQLRTANEALEKEREELTKTKEKFEKLKVKSQEMLGQFKAHKAQMAEKDEKQKDLEGLCPLSCASYCLPTRFHA